MNHYITVLKKYAVFSGRASRSEFWFFILFNFIISFVLGYIESMVHLTFKFGVGMGKGQVGILSSLYSLFVLVPSLAVLVRRLHDTNKSGWWALLMLIPYLGALVLIIMAVLDSNPGDNRFGSNPKGLASANVSASTASTSESVTDTTATTSTNTPNSPEVQPNEISAGPQA